MEALGLLLEDVRQQILREGGDGLRPSHYRVLSAVPADAGITVTELAARVGMTKQGIGQFVTQLSEDGYLATASDPRDGRARIVRRTRLGNDAIGRLAVMLEAVEADWAKRVGRRRYREFRVVLQEIAGVEPA